jgi:transposase
MGQGNRSLSAISWSGDDQRAGNGGLETGPTSTWLWTEIKALGLPVICIDARHAKAVVKMQINKSDRNDAFGIARIMRCGWYKEVRVNPDARLCSRFR